MAHPDSSAVRPVDRVFNCAEAENGVPDFIKNSFDIYRKYRYIVGSSMLAGIRFCSR